MGPNIKKYLRLKLRVRSEEGKPAHWFNTEVYDTDTGAILPVSAFEIVGGRMGDKHHDLIEVRLRCVMEIEVVTGIPIKDHS